jgi:hypothetical protein
VQHFSDCSAILQKAPEQYHGKNKLAAIKLSYYNDVFKKGWKSA